MRKSRYLQDNQTVVKWYRAKIVDCERRASNLMAWVLFCVVKEGEQVAFGCQRGVKCVWGKRIDDKRVVCLFPRCVLAKKEFQAPKQKPYSDP